MPAISIIIPLYNSSKYVKYTILSLREQSFKNFECIIVDDCSTDNSINIINDIICDDNRFKIIRFKENSGVAAARNMGLMCSSGDYIIFLDSDDMLSKTCLEERYNCAISNKYSYVAGSYGWHESIPESHKEIKSSSDYKSNIISFYSTFGDSKLLIHSPMLRSDIAKNIGGFDEKNYKNGPEDYAFWIKILRHGFVFIPTNKIDCFYREKPDSRVRRDADSHLIPALEILSNSNKKIEDYNFYHISNMKMINPSYSYQLERLSHIRIFKFLGMMIYNGCYENIDFEIIANYIPNFFLGFPFEGDELSLMERGILRSKCDITDESLNSYQLICLNIISQLINITRNKFYENNIKVDCKQKIDINSYLYSPDWQSNIDIIFIPHKDYHVETIYSLMDLLYQNGLKFVVIDPSSIYGDWGVKSICYKYNLPFVSLQEFCISDFCPKCVAVFNDWDRLVTRPSIIAAKKTGIVALGIVEGIQDYEDVDTGRIRHPYKNCSHVITPCDFDLKYFDVKEQIVYSGGIPRLSSLIKECSKHSYSIDAPILINSNFSYGVLENIRDFWLREAVGACLELKYSYIISQHPADFADLKCYNVTNCTMYEAIWNCSLFISRFSSGIIESIAMKRPVIYFNPHNEKVDKFSDPMGAYYIAHDREELKTAILNTFDNLDNLRKHWNSFLELHAGCSYDNPDSSIKLVSDSIIKSLSSIRIPKIDERRKFAYNLRENIKELYFI